MSRVIAAMPSGIETLMMRRLRLDWRSLLIAAVYVVLYVALDRLSYVQPVFKLDITPWSPEAGLTLAFLLVRGPRWFPATAVAAFASEVLLHGMPAAWYLLLGTSVWIALGYASLAGVLRRWNMPCHIESPITAVRLIISVVLATFVVAAGYVAAFIEIGALPENAATGSIARYWVGDLNGVLTLTPFLLYADKWREGWRALCRHWRLVGAQLGTVVLAMGVIFGPSAPDQVTLFYLLFVPVIWVALRWGVPGTVLSTLVIQIALIIAVQDEANPPALVDLQFLLLTLSLTALLLGSVVTERADALQRVARQEAEQRTLLATAPDAVLTVDSGGRIRSANPAALHLFGSHVGPQAGRPIGEVLPTIQFHSVQGRASLEGCRADGDTFPADIAWARLEFPANGDYLVIVRDATVQRRAEIQLRERDSALARAMRFAVAGELASALAHELNQPITALVSYLQASEIMAAPLALQDKRLSGTLAKAAHEAIRASEVLRRLRDFYRGGAIKREQLQIGSLSATVAAAFQERLRADGIELSLNVPENLPNLEVGVIQLEMVLHNLMSNSIDALNQGPLAMRRIEIMAECSATEVLLRVEDSGPGVATDVVEKVFEPFVTNKVDGMGLGLAISRSLLRAQGGDLVYSSGSQWGGACFMVRLPLRLPPELDRGRLPVKPSDSKPL